ncbi:MAG: ATP-binding protein, partial [Thermoplasmata archaeon]
KNTIYSYLEYLNDSMILYQLRKFSRSYKEVYQSIPKMYFVDNGFLLIQGIKDIGRFMEGVVFVDLLRKGFKINRDLFYYKKNEHEVDFLIRGGTEVKQLIQVTYASGKDEIEKREFKSLIKASNEFG